MFLDRLSEIEEVRTSVRSFVAREIETAIGGYEQNGEFPRELARRMGEAGSFGASSPLAADGAALGFAAVAAVSEEISRLRSAVGYCMNLRAMTCPFAILNWGTDAQIGRFVPDLIMERKIGRFALTEPGGRSDPAAERPMFSMGRRFLAVFRTQPTRARSLPARIPPLSIAPSSPSSPSLVPHRAIPPNHPNAWPVKVTGEPQRPSGRDLAVPDENRLGEEGDGLRIAMNARGYGRLTVAARLMTGRAAMLADVGRPFHRAVARAKYFPFQLARRAVLAATGNHGRYALAAECSIGDRAAYVNMLNTGEGPPTCSAS
jgi:Acyl-CoA dehydrogenase, N-terminal domain